MRVPGPGAVVDVPDLRDPDGVLVESSGRRGCLRSGHSRGGRPVRKFYDDEGMNFAVLLALGFVYRGLADAGEILATIERVPEGDREAWVREWTATADHLRDDADAAEKRGHRVSARAKLLRASTYYDHASSGSPGTASDDRFTPLWELHRDCWDRAIALFDPPVEPIEIPYEGTSLAG
jgi:hypothetical protein